MAKRKGLKDLHQPLRLRSNIILKTNPKVQDEEDDNFQIY